MPNTTTLKDGRTVELPEGYSRDNGHGLPTHVYSRAQDKWLRTPEGYARDEERVNGKTHCLWRGEWYETPTNGQLEEWVSDSVCETPDGDTVDPDHPESWLRILGLI